MTENNKTLSLLSLPVEILMLCVRTVFYIIESFYYLVMPLPVKSLDGDIVLVSVKFNSITIIPMS